MTHDTFACKYPKVCPSQTVAMTDLQTKLASEHLAFFAPRSSNDARLAIDNRIPPEFQHSHSFVESHIRRRAKQSLLHEPENSSAVHLCS